MVHPMKKIKKIEVTPYNPEWPHLFENEAQKIRLSLQSNCIAVYHIGSTSVPGLSAKPVIDIISVVHEAEEAIAPLEAIGYEYRGEYNIPMRYFFNLTEPVHVNLHVYEENHPEIELNLLFRDFLCSHPDALKEYEKLKIELLKDPSSHEKKGLFSGYTLGKDSFIKKTLQELGFLRLRVVKSAHYEEWDAVNRFRKEYFSDLISSCDPFETVLNDLSHAHLIFYEGMVIVGYGHIQFCSKEKAILRVFIVDQSRRGQRLGSHFLNYCEQWLRRKQFQYIDAKIPSHARSFFLKKGYAEISYEDLLLKSVSFNVISMRKML